jgi:two-component system chemotaxis response regulator CheB
MVSVTETDSAPAPADPVRVLVVDDSGVVRSFLTRFIEEDSDLKVVATAPNGERAIRAVEADQIDVVVLDIEMPVMDGLTALPKILQTDPCVQVIIASTLTKENAVITLKCLELGAAECLAKPNSQELALGQETFKRNLMEKVKALGGVARKRRARLGSRAKTAPRPEERQPVAAPAMAPAPKPPPPRLPSAPKTFTLRPELVKAAPDIIAIGSSTGGPQALMQFFTALRSPLRQPVLVTQHMPATFTTILAEHITQQSKLICREAVQGEEVKGGIIYLAPGNFHMTVKPDGMRKIISLNQDPPENFCRPAADPMLRSVVEAYGRKVLAVIFTGMGSDGAKGCKAVVDAGGTVLAQDEATSVVWGMPGAVAMAGLCTQVLPLESMAHAVRDYADRLVRV